MATKKESTTKSEADDSVDNETATAAEEVTPSAAISSTNKVSDDGFFKRSSILMAMIVAIPAGAIVAYVVIPDELTEAFSTSTTANEITTNDFQLQPAMPAQTTSGNLNNNQPPEWVVKHRAEMEMHRAELDKRNAENRAASRAGSEQPQWVKDQQARMEQEQQKHQEWVKQQSELARNRAAAYPANRQYPAMNGYQPNPATMSNQIPAQQRPGQYYNPYPVNPYYNRPYYPNAPYNAPYGYPRY